MRSWCGRLQTGVRAQFGTHLALLPLQPLALDGELVQLSLLLRDRARRRRPGSRHRACRLPFVQFRIRSATTRSAKLLHAELERSEGLAASCSSQLPMQPLQLPKRSGRLLPRSLLEHCEDVALQSSGLWRRRAEARSGATSPAERRGGTARATVEYRARRRRHRACCRRIAARDPTQRGHIRPSSRRHWRRSCRCLGLVGLRGIRSRRRARG